MLAHLSLLPASTDYPCMAFLDDEYRKYPLINKELSIWHSIFALYDYFNFHGLKQVDIIPLQTIMQLPLHKHLIGLSEDYWLQRRPKFPASKFLVFGRQHQRLRLCVPFEDSIVSTCVSLIPESIRRL